MFKVFHVITHLDLGGGERVAMNIAESPNRDFEYHIVEVIRGQSKFSLGMLNELRSQGVIIHQSPVILSKKWGIILFPFWFIFVFLKYKPNIIHSHTEVPDISVYMFYLLFSCVARKVKYVRTIHNTVLWSSWKNIGEKVEVFFKKQHANVAISISTQERYKEEYRELPPIIYNGLEEVEQKPFDDIVKSKINVLFTGRMESQKGIDEMIAVLKALQEDERYFFHVVGNGSLRGKVDHELNNQSNVRLYDKVYGLSHYMGAFDYLFMPSNFEGLGLTSIESSLAKTPVIVNDCLGLNETVPKDWMLKVKDNKVDHFLRIFREILPNKDRTILANIAYDFVSNKFSLKEMRRKYEEFYKEKL